MAQYDWLSTFRSGFDSRHLRHISQRGRGLAVMTLASGASNRGFESLRPHKPWDHSLTGKPGDEPGPKAPDRSSGVL